MTHNLMGSLALFIADGDSGENIGDSFDPRNISNGTVRDEDEWGKGNVRTDPSGNVLTWTIMTSAAHAKHLCRNWPNLNNPEDSQLHEDFEVLQNKITTVLEMCISEEEGKECHVFGKDPIAQQFDDKLAALGRGEID